MTNLFNGWTETPEQTHDRWIRNCAAADLWITTHCAICGTVLVEETRVGTMGDDYQVYSICPKCGLEQ